MKNILVTGGLGFIGSHVCVDLIEHGYYPIIVDNLCNSKIEVLDKIKQICNKNYDQYNDNNITDNKNNMIKFYNIDINDKHMLDNIFNENTIDCVIHMAALKSVNQSVSNPLEYYQNNVVGTINLLDIMKKHSCKSIIFSSSATVYGEQQYPVTEDCNTGINISNPYGKTKYMIEQILIDLYKADPTWNITILRYFNPVGAHKSGLLGEDPNDIPNNLFPYILRVAKGTYNKLIIYGNDYDTQDGTCLRDYIHVSDLSNGHIIILQKMIKGLNIYNLGTGNPISVLEFVNKFIEVNKININYEFGNRRHGDIPSTFSNVDLIYKELGWKTKYTLEDICKDGWNYIKNN